MTTQLRRAEILLVTPALADANNGNWRTAQRWARMLRQDYQVRVVPEWHAAGDRGSTSQLMLALHARRSAPSIRNWRAAHPLRPLVVVLTGTDLYRDIQTDPDAQQSLHLADHLLVLNALGLRALPPHLRSKASVCLQSSPARQPLWKTARHLRALMVGHLRAEKCPQTYMDAAVQLAIRPDMLLDHIGRALDPALGAAARACMALNPRYRWLGEQTHEVARSRIQRAHLLVHSSRIEGGAQAVVEAITSGTPVLASAIDGNLGLLGSDYNGLFDVGDSAGLAALLLRCRDDPAMLLCLSRQCAARAALFAPEHERQTLLALVGRLLDLHPAASH